MFSLTVRGLTGLFSSKKRKKVKRINQGEVVTNDMNEHERLVYEKFLRKSLREIRLNLNKLEYAVAEALSMLDKVTQ